MSGIDKVGMGDHASAQILRPGRARSGVVLKNWADVVVHNPAIFETRHELVDCYGVRCKPGQMVKTWKKDFQVHMHNGSVRYIDQPPLVKSAAGGTNLVVGTSTDDTCFNNLLNAYLGGDAQTTAWYVGLTDDSPTPAAGDDSASHAGWTEFTEYTETVLQTWTVNGNADGGSVTNSSSTADFSINQWWSRWSVPELSEHEAYVYGHPLLNRGHHGWESSGW